MKRLNGITVDSNKRSQLKRAVRLSIRVSMAPVIAVVALLGAAHAIGASDLSQAEGSETYSANDYSAFGS